MPDELLTDPINIIRLVMHPQGLRSRVVNFADYSEYVRVIPAHLEIDTARLGADVHAGIAQAKQLFEQLKAHGWRKEVGRRLSLKVDEARREEKAA